MSSYERLAERLIETQRTMLGDRAVDIARAIDGLSVSEDGQVADVSDDDRMVIGDLVESYTEVMGSSAGDRLTEVAQEYEGLVLPPNLGGPEDEPEQTAPTSTSDEPEQTSEQAPAEAATESEPATGTDTGTVSDAATTDEDGSDRELLDKSEIVTNIWGQEYTADDTDRTEAPRIDVVDTDLDAIYVTVDQDSGETIVPVSQALVDTIVDATDLGESDLDDLASYVDAEQIVRLVQSDSATRLAFAVEGYEVTLHKNGDITVAE